VAHGPIFIPDDEYQRIRQQMPIPCVDLLVLKPSCEILLVQRTNEPARGWWWLPGGRVAFGETRAEATLRKLREECNLEAVSTRELGTFDIFLGFEDGKQKSHAITTVFRVDVDDSAAIMLDGQAATASWCSKEEWLRRDVHPFVRRCLDFV
jgi:colanic acid biosynthesis protein WcaH